MNGSLVDNLWVIVCAALVLLMQVGFTFLEVGFVRTKNLTTTAFKNLIDMVVVFVSYFFIGFGLMYGMTGFGFVGTSFFMLEGVDEIQSFAIDPYVFFLFQLTFASTALTIVSGSMAERTKFISYLCVSLLMGIIIYPIIGHWAWGDIVNSGNETWLVQLGFIDFAGSTVVHSTGGWVALVGAWLVGPRLGRYTRDGKIRQMRTYGLVFSVIGVLILMVSWWGFNGGSVLRFDSTVGKIILNTNLSAASAALFGFFHAFFIQKKLDLREKIIGSFLGGLVAISACCNIVEPLEACLIGILASLVHNYSYEYIIFKLKIDDVVGAIPVHGCCGVLGTLCVAFFGELSAFEGNTRIEQLVVQVLGCFVCMIWSVSMSLVIFSILKSSVGLRVSPKLEFEGLNFSKEFEKNRGEIKISESELQFISKTLDGSTLIVMERINMFGVSNWEFISKEEYKLMRVERKLENIQRKHLFFFDHNYDSIDVEELLEDVTRF